MFRTTLSRTVAAVTGLVLVCSLFGVTPAMADRNGVGKFIAGLAVGAIVVGALSDDCHGPRYYPPPPPEPCYRPAPPVYYPTPRQSYNSGYRHGYRDGRTDQWYADRYGYSRPAAYCPPRYYPTPGYRPPRPVCW